MKWSDVQADGVEFTTPLPDESVLNHLSSKNAPILDIGCGYGRILAYLQALGYTNLTGIDTSTDLLFRANKKGIKAILLEGNMEELEGQKGLNQQYELILLMGVIEYILDDFAQDKFMNIISNKLTPNGKVFLETFTLDWRKNWQEYILGFIKTGRIKRFFNGMEIETYHQGEQNLLRILRNNFAVVEYTRKRFVTWSGTSCNGLQVVMSNF